MKRKQREFVLTWWERSDATNHQWERKSRTMTPEEAKSFLQRRRELSLCQNHYLTLDRWLDVSGENIVVNEGHYLP
jgi:hypothetical protein